MERLLIYGSITNDPLYNCSARTPEMIKLSTATPNLPFGIGLLVLGTVTEFVLFPCIKVMLEPTNIVYPAYKLMTSLSICDVFSVIGTCCLTGALSIFGVSFCDSPNIIYMLGSITGGLWITSSLLSLALITNRLVAIGSVKGSLLNYLFNGKSTYFLIIGAALIGSYYAMRRHPVILHINHLVPIWDPLIYPNSLHLYFDNFLLFNNCFIVSCTAILYIVFCFKIANTVRKNKIASNIQTQKSRFFAQCSVIVGFNCTAAAMYILASIINLPIFLQVFAALSYPLTITVPAYAYLFLNNTIRNGVKKLFCKNSAQHSTHTTSNLRWPLTCEQWSSTRIGDYV